MSLPQDHVGKPKHDSTDAGQHMENALMNEPAGKIHTLSPASQPTITEQQQWYEEDSINLVDLWLELVKRRVIIFTSIVLALIAGLLLAFLLPQKYNYTSTIEIGSTLTQTASGTTPQLIDPPETVLAKIQESYIPLAQQQFRKTHPDNNAFYNIDARIPKGSQLVVLEAKGTAADSASYLQQLQTVTKYLLHDHQRVMNVYQARLNNRLALAKIKLDEITDPSTLATLQKQLESQLNSARIKLDELRDPRVLAVPRQQLENKLAREEKQLTDLKDQTKLIKARYQRLDEIDILLKQQISDLESQIDSSLAQRKQAIGNMQSESAAMAMLLIDNGIQQNRTRLAALQERLFIDQQNLRLELEEKIAANLRSQSVQSKLIDKTNSELSRLKIGNQRALQRHQPEIGKLEEKLAKLSADSRRSVERQQQTIIQIEAQLNNLKATRTIAPPMQSLQPTGPGKNLIIILSLVLGLMFGIFAAFFASFLSKAKQHKVAADPN
ncbi:MAG: Wzz/FepE/Etk N-terminal domain-containing protein [Gammaproteobacteria bacterium]|nr:Wzz/FepE/Etk N-terminal domain-containing protein [Gammaproteobacteria bacterium]